MPIAPNLLGQDFSCDPSRAATAHAKAPDQVWLSDITYLWTREGWLYVCAVLDLFTRQIVGWVMAEQMTRQLVLDALEMAHKVRAPATGLIFHSDRGSQYASHEVRTRLAARAMPQSMSGTGNRYDNAPMKSYWHSLNHCAFVFPEGWYNTTRMHSSLGYKSPAQFERDCHVKSIEAANDDQNAILGYTSQPARLQKRPA